MTEPYKFFVVGRQEETAALLESMGIAFDVQYCFRDFHGTEFICYPSNNAEYKQLTLTFKQS